VEPIRTISDLRELLDPIRRDGGRVGMIGTSGAVHGGHQLLVRTAVAENDIAVMFWGGGSRFDWTTSDVPTDRDYERDAALVFEAGAHAIFMPFDEELFPRAPFTQVRLPAMSSGAAGLEDPMHLDLIALFMAKLWNIFGPCRSYFGEKDWQQLAMFRRLADDLAFPIEVVGCPTVREPDGLALSSRNERLSTDDRRRAPALYRALQAASARIDDGERNVIAVEKVFREAVGDAGDVVYFVAVEADTMTPLDELAGEARLLASLAVGEVRLVDNIGVSIP